MHEHYYHSADLARFGDIGKNSRLEEPAGPQQPLAAAQQARAAAQRIFNVLRGFSQAFFIN